MALAANPPLVPELGSTVSSQWSQFALAPSAPQAQRSGFALGALPDQGLAAFEFSGQASADWQGGTGRQMSMVSKLKRGGGTELSAYDDNFDYLSNGEFRTASSTYGTVVTSVNTDLGANSAFVSARILRPDGTWVRLPKLSGINYAADQQVGVTISDSGVVVYTRLGLGSAGTTASRKLIAAVWRPGDAAWSNTLTIDQNAGVYPRGSAPTATVTSAGDVIVVAGLPAPSGPGYTLRSIVNANGQSSWGAVTAVDMGPSLVEQYNDATEMQGEQQWAMASGADGWTYLALMVSNANAPALTLLRRTPAGTWLPNGTTLNTNVYGRWGSSLWRLRVLPGAAGAATVLWGSANKSVPFELTSTDVNSDGIASPAQKLAGGAVAGMFDTAVAANGEQAVIWSRLAEDPTTSTLKRAVAVQRRAGTTGSWGTPELLSENTRVYNPSAQGGPGSFLAPRLMPSGNALYAGWYEEQDSGNTLALRTAVSGYVPSAPKPGTGGNGGSTLPVSQAAAGSRTLNINALLRFRSKARKCPQAKNIAIAVRKQRANGTLSSRALATESVALSTKLVSGGCQVTGTVVLKRRQQAGTRAGVTIRALGYRVRAARIVLK